MSLQNHAAWQNEADGPLVVGPAPFPTAKNDEVIVKVTAVAINPADFVYARQSHLFGHLQGRTDPRIFGFDGAGVVVAVGSDVKSLKPGDRVMGFPWMDVLGLEYCTFQEYTKFVESTTSKTPDNISDVEASTVSTCVGTAAAALFGQNHLQLALPPADGSRREKNGQTVFVWGGSTSVGASGIQMLTASGYDVIATASPHNFELIQSIGASQVLDYKSETIEDDLVAAAQGKTIVGAFAALANEQSATALCKVLARTNAIKKYLPVVYPALEQYACEGVKVAFIHMGDVRKEPMGAHLWQGYLPNAIKNGNFKIVPQPKVVGKGLGDIDKALDAWKAGVSATKIVVEL